MCESLRCVHLHLCPLLWAEPWEMIFRDHAPVQELHDVKRGPNDIFIFAKTVYFWHGNVCLTQGLNYFVFSVDSMGCSREEFAGRLLAHHIFGTCGIGDLVCRVRLTEAELEFIIISIYFNNRTPWSTLPV